MGKEDFDAVFCRGTFGILMNNNLADKRPDDFGRQLCDIHILVGKLNEFVFDTEFYSLLIPAQKNAVYSSCFD